MQNKEMYLVIEISQILKNYECTYSEVEKILSVLNDEFKQQREELEYASYDDYFNRQKTKHVDNEVIQSLNHVNGFC